MPNIELHGFGELNGTRLGNQIWDATKDLPFANDMSCCTKSYPFRIEVISSS